MQDAVHDAVLADGGWRRARRIAQHEQVVGSDERAVGVADLVGLGVEQVEQVELDARSAVEPIADARVEEADRWRAKRIVLGGGEADSFCSR